MGFFHFLLQQSMKTNANQGFMHQRQDSSKKRSPIKGRERTGMVRTRLFLRLLPPRWKKRVIDRCL